MLETGTAANGLSRSLTQLSQVPEDSEGRRPSLLWLEGYTPNQILIPLRSLISCFLKSPANRRVSVGATEGLGRGCSSACPKGSAICWAPIAVTQAGGPSSVLNLLCAKDWVDENCKHRSGV